MVRESWTSLPNAVEMKQVLDFVNLLKERKSEGVTEVGVVLSFTNRRVQPIKDRVHLGSEYSGTEGPTRESSETWTEKEIIR